MDIIVVTAILAFLGGMAVGIAGYFFCTILRYEKEIEAIFDGMCEKYDRKLARKDEENRRLHESLVNVQARLARKEAENDI